MAPSSYTNYSYRVPLAQYGFYQCDFDYTQLKMIKYDVRGGKKLSNAEKFYIHADKRERLLTESLFLLAASATQAPRNYVYSVQTMM